MMIGILAFLAVGENMIFGLLHNTGMLLDDFVYLRQALCAQDLRMAMSYYIFDNNTLYTG
jgi:hypothetical protein